VLRPEGLRTGDLARRDQHGLLYVVSRARDVIKCGAYRIGPREIEDQVVLLDGVVEAAAVGLPDPILGESIALAVVLAEGVALEAAAVRRYCRDNLTSYKVPQQVFVVDAIPKTPSGKFKREQLKQQLASLRQAATAVPAAPASKTKEGPA
jgi:acyl-coenzyme A synthetase/AMP-(fatty) acid ligase